MSQSDFATQYAANPRAFQHHELHEHALKHVLPANIGNTNQSWTCGKCNSTGSTTQHMGWFCEQNDGFGICDMCFWGGQLLSKETTLAAHQEITNVMQQAMANMNDPNAMGNAMGQTQAILQKYQAQMTQLSFSFDYYCRQGDTDFANALNQEASQMMQGGAQGIANIGMGMMNMGFNVEIKDNQQQQQQQPQMNVNVPVPNISMNIPQVSIPVPQQVVQVVNVVQQNLGVPVTAIEVTGFQKVFKSNGEFDHATYTLQCIAGDQSWVVVKRYSQVYDFFSRLLETEKKPHENSEQEFKSQFPYPPGKSIKIKWITDHSSDKFIEKRLSKFNDFFPRLFDVPAIRQEARYIRIVNSFTKHPKDNEFDWSRYPDQLNIGFGFGGGNTKVVFKVGGGGGHGHHHNHNHNHANASISFNGGGGGGGGNKPKQGYCSNTQCKWFMGGHNVARMNHHNIKCNKTSCNKFMQYGCNQHSYIPVKSNDFRRHK